MAFWSKKNPIKKIRKALREHFFFKDKRPLFDVNLEGIYDDADFKNRTKEPYFEYGKAIEEVFAPDELMDIGCANGYLLEYFYKKGMKELKGMEGSVAAFNYISPELRGKVFRVDLTKDLQASAAGTGLREYSLVNCTEVGEHIPFKYEEVFIRNVTSVAGRYLILSWADTWEGWQGMDKQQHVNPRSKRYVIRKLKALGLVFNKALTDRLVGSMAKKNVLDHWIKRAMVFERV